MQSLQWSITGHERRAAVSAATSTALIEKYSQEQIPDRRQTAGKQLLKPW